MNKTYAEKLRHPNWQKKRLEIMELDRFRCRHCESKDISLNVHHLYYINGAEPWEYDNNALITLCEICHEKVRHIAWQRAFMDLNMSEFDLIELAAQLHFRRKKFIELCKSNEPKYTGNRILHPIYDV